MAKVFNPKLNKRFRDGTIVRWILKKGNQIIGRIAAFTNASYASGFDIPVGGMGFFEYINDQAAANLLFDAARQWLEKQGMEAMDGPINFGEKNMFWGYSQKILRLRLPME